MRWNKMQRFRQTVGVRQGCVLSPDLFNLFLEHVLAEALDVYQGGALINGRRVSNLRFADDIDLMGETVMEAQDIVQDVHESSQRYGLEISKDKTSSACRQRTARHNHQDRRPKVGSKIK